VTVIPKHHMPELTGEELYRRFLDGDKDAFQELVDLYGHELSLFLYGIVHDRHEAKHLSIETFAQLAASGGRFSKKSSLKTYLFTIGKNLAAKHVKMRGREAHISFEEIAGTLLDKTETPEQSMEKEENRRLIGEAIRAMNDDYRVVIELLYFDDMSYLEAGRVMKKSVKQIGDLAYRAKASLKKRLKSEGLTHV